MCVCKACKEDDVGLDYRFTFNTTYPTDKLYVK